MNKNEKFVITINRELGSGGRTVGRKLAERLGVEYYDKAVVYYDSSFISRTISKWGQEARERRDVELLLKSHV